MQAVELFAGIGGFRLGLERNNIKVIWANEFDKYACDTYDKNFSDGSTPPIDRRDITTVDVRDIPTHDLLTGGFPCQAFSVAGQRRGFDETRGTLFFDIARIAAHHRPRHLLLENVKGLLNHDSGKTFTTILGVLTELGYDVEWQLFNSKDWGVPQNRERVYIIGHLRDECTAKVLPITPEVRRATEVSNDAGSRSEAFIKTRHLSQNGSLISDAITLQASETPHVIAQLNPGSGQDHRVYDQSGVAPTLSPAAGVGGAVIPKIVDTKTAYSLKASDYKKTGDDFVNKRQGPFGIINGRIRKLTPVECERLQGFPDNWTEGVSDTQRYKQCGNAVTVNVVEVVAKHLI